ncbi:qde-2-interacting protein [Colletotrichum kahawae]|uniref:Qde-2-interacting protein n=1 Tax=Colletotrichum kahawae TaxID=34407 RepID=A0AAD9Y336_COLKA|nr:qde-2-interacting protein [Colletotrichum kahawae]
MIVSHQFTIGNSRYCKRASNRFLFGTSQPITIEELKPKVEALFDVDRDIVLVSHGTNSDLKIIHQLNINLPSRSLYIIDTNKAAQFPLQLYYRYGLEKLLDALHIPFGNLHAAGNDARFCLQALLMLVVRDAERQPRSCSEALIHLLRDVAQQPRPSTAGEIQGPLEEARRQEKIDQKARRIEKRAARKQRRLLLRAEREGEVPHSEKIEAPEDTPAQVDEPLSISKIHVIWLICAIYTMCQLWRQLQ